MKNILSYMVLPLYAIFCLACHAHLAPQSSVSNIETKDAHGNPMLLGACSRTKLEQAPYDSWFTKNYHDYVVDSATAGRLRPGLKGKTFMIFMGTWCGDSRREVPRMLRILDYCGIPAKDMRLIMVNAADSVYKQSPGHEERGLNIFRVPDLLIYDHGRELGRIVESPVVSLEKDMLVLTRGGAYTPSYPEVERLIRLFGEKTPQELEDHLAGYADELRPLAASPSGLLTYAHVLQASNDLQKAAIVLKLKDLIFPPGK